MAKRIIEFPMYRDFGNIIGDSFAFVIQNIKTFTLGFLVYVFPFFLLGTAISWLIVQAFGGLESLGIFSYSAGNLVFVLGSLMGSVVMYAMVFAAVDAYRENNRALEIGDLWPKMSNYLGRIILFFLIYFSAVAVLAAIGVLTFSVVPVLGAVVFPVIFFGAIYLMIKYVFVIYVCINEERTITESFSRTAKLIENHWWWTFLIVIVLSVIATMASYVVSIPVMIYTWSKMFLDLEGGAFTQSPSIGVIIATGISTIASLFVQIYFIVGVILHYYALREKKEGTTLMDKIQQIGNMKSNQFENEGEF